MPPYEEEEESDYYQRLDRFTSLSTQIVSLALEEKRIITKLHEACQYRTMENKKIIKMITPFNLNSLDRLNRTMLHKAVRTNNYELVRELIRLGAYINTVDLWNKTPLISAIELNLTQMAKLLICNISNNQSKYFQIENQCFNSALFRTYMNAINQFYSYLSSLNNEACSFSNYSHFKTKIPLHLSVSSSNFEITYCLLLHGADPNECDNLGLTSLHRAAATKCLNIVKLLIAFHANPNIKSNRKILPLHWSCRWSDSSTIEYLLEKTEKRNLNIVDERKFSPLDRLWCRLNSFKYKKIEDKLEYDESVKLLQLVFRKSILTGCVLRLYKLDPFNIYQNYYLINNLLMLAETLFALKRPAVDYCRSQSTLQLFTTNIMRFIIDKLCSKYLNLIKEKSNQDEQPLNDLVDFELNDLVNELKRLKRLVYIVITSGQFNYDFYSDSTVTHHFYSVARQFLIDFFNGFLEIKETVENKIEDLFNLKIVKSMSIQSLRNSFISYLMNHSFIHVVSPLKLQELCRIKIKNSIKIFNPEVVNEQLGLTQPAKEFLFYSLDSK